MANPKREQVGTIANTPGFIMVDGQHQADTQ